MARLTPTDAGSMLRQAGLDPYNAPDFFTLPADTVEALLAEADRHGYRKPRNANGSRGRYFYAYILRSLKAAA